MVNCFKLLQCTFTLDVIIWQASRPKCRTKVALLICIFSR